nr:unnamed protein product [Callosobruchus chinensis]
MAVRLGRSISRNNSNASRQLNGVCESVSEQETPEKPTNSGVNKQNTKTLSKSKTGTFDNGRRTIITLMGGRGYVNYSNLVVRQIKRNHPLLVLMRTVMTLISLYGS